MGVNITIIEPQSANYTVWIEYYNDLHSLSVCVAAGEGKARPASPIAYLENVSFNDTAYVLTEFGVLSMIGQFLQVRSWSFTFEPPHRDSLKWRLLLPTLTLVAIIVLVAIAVGTWYLTSKQRRWKKELEKLTKTMQRLPGVPTHVDFAHVRKATANFHGSMKLGKGGFGSVYRCKLPVPAADCASASTRTGNMIEVAVKKFTREVEEQRYEDFLAEVSIINRLCHKNIVPLVGKHLLTMDLWPFISIIQINTQKESFYLVHHLSNLHLPLANNVKNILPVQILTQLVFATAPN